MMKIQSLLTAALLLPLSLQSASAEAKRDITVEDTITMTRWGDVPYFWGNNPDANIATYSPDGKHFVIVLRKANIKTNKNEYSIYLYTTSTIFKSAKPVLLLTRGSETNYAAIRGVKWLDDSRTLAFIADSGDGIFQVYTLNVQTRGLVQRTFHATGVDKYDISPQGNRILFTAKVKVKSALNEEQRVHGVVIENQALEDIIAEHFNHNSAKQTLFCQDDREREIVVPPTHQVDTNSQISFSPDGAYATVTAYFLTGHSDWASYNNNTLRFWATTPPQGGGGSPIAQYFLFDSTNRTLRPLLDAPAVYSASSHWAPDSKTVYLKTFLPVKDVPEVERSERVRSELPAAVAVPNLTLRRLQVNDWERSLDTNNADLPEIVLREDVNTPPKIFVHDRQSDRSTEMLDLNPQFCQLKFGRVEQLHLQVDGVPVIAGIYLPPDYVAGRRYPLVVQTHGYDPKRFSMDGRNEWSSAFAARVLAANGIIVLQMDNFENPADHDKVGDDRTLGRTVNEAFRNFNIDSDNQAVQTLIDRGMVDKDRVAISGFSRQAWFVSYLLTHDPKVKYKTAVLADGIDGGYFEYIAEQDTEFDQDNGGLAPFGSAGLQLWMREAPGFSLDRVHLPIRIVSIESRIPLWEWYVGLKLQHKPVELIEIPDGSHMLEKPWDRRIAIQGLVDWYRFWLQGYEDPDGSKKEQYKRWEHLRELRDADDKAAGFALPDTVESVQRP
jgi:dipeptidyl aminopeptidase/acylaminoacyl peptidase